MKKNSPCRNCNERHAECHAKCLKYIDWRQALDVERTMIRKKKDAHNNLMSYETTRLIKARERKRQKGRK